MLNKKISGVFALFTMCLASVNAAAQMQEISYAEAGYDADKLASDAKAVTPDTFNVVPKVAAFPTLNVDNIVVAPDIFNESFVSTVSLLQSQVLNQLTEYSKSTNFNKFGGRFKYSKLQNIIDETDRNAITSNITKVKIRRDLKASINQLAQYELCFGNQFHVSEDGKNIKSTGFRVSGESDIVYLTDVPNADKKTGILSIVKNLPDGTIRVIAKSAGTVDYVNGTISVNSVFINSVSNVDGATSTQIRVTATPNSLDIVPKRNQLLEIDLVNTTINGSVDSAAVSNESGQVTQTTTSSVSSTSGY